MDLRVKKTYNALIAAFTDLLEEKVYEDITIGTLCERAMIRRTTFYKHFKDKNEFLAFYMEQLRNAFRERVAEKSSEISAFECEMMMADELMTFLSDHANLVGNVLKSNALDSLLWSFSDLIADEMRDCMAADSGPRVPEPDREAFAVFASGGMIKMIIQWWMDGHSKAGREKVFRVIELLHTGMEFALQEDADSRLCA